MGAEAPREAVQITTEEEAAAEVVLPEGHGVVANPEEAKEMLAVDEVPKEITETRKW